jgi:putative ABC transport system permease protein
VWRATWKGLLGHKLRLALTALAIFLGTSFVAGSYVFTDTLGGLFDNLFASAFAGTDVLVQATVDQDLNFVQRQRFDAGVVDQVKAVDGVAAAEGTVGGFVSLADLNGDLIGGQGPPTLASAWITVGNPFELRAGGPPTGQGQMVVDKASADRFGLTVHSKVQVIALGKPEVFEVVGLIGLGSSDGFGGATAVGFEKSVANRLFGAQGQIDAVNVVGDEGIDPKTLAARIQAILPPGIQAVDARQAAEEQLAGFKQALGFINTFLLVFGLVALFAGTFLIQNTFQIIVTQRTRELAMLRAIGATRGQVLRMVLGEASLVSIAASLLGVGGGIGLAQLIRLAFERFGGTIPNSPLVVRPRTLLIALVTGLLVTMISAVVPALNASRIPPVAAMREALARPGAKSLHRRSLLGGLLAAGGIVVLFAGLNGAAPESLSPVAMVGLGAGALFVGIAVLTPLFARPVGRGLGAPIAATGAIGRLARENAVRSPRRTAATSSSLMIGTALAGLALILGASLSTTTDALIKDRFRSDLIVQPAGFGGAELSPELATEIAALPQVSEVAAVRRNAAKIDLGTTGASERIFLGASNLEVLTRLVRIQVIEGDLADLADGQIALSQDLASAGGLRVGDAAEVTFGRTGAQRLSIGAIYTVEGPGADAYITVPTWDANYIERYDSSIFVDLADGVTLSDGRKAVESVADDFPGANVLDQNQFAEEAKTQIRQFIGLVFALLALTLVIGFVGILNTLLLSIIERRREIGLLRAVGTTRRQLARMVTWESVIVAVFGATLGIALGIFFGWAVITTLQQDSELILTIPWGLMAVSVTAAAVAGVVAAVYPAWRGAKLNVVEAIAYE